MQARAAELGDTHTRLAHRAGEHEIHGGTNEGNRRDGSGRGSGRDHTRGAA